MDIEGIRRSLRLKARISQGRDAKEGNKDNGDCGKKIGERIEAHATLVMSKK